MMGNEREIHLPEEIKKAVLDGFDVYITKTVSNGVISAKVTFHKVKTAGAEKLGAIKP